MMGSGAETAEETINALNARGAKLGLIKVRLYRPFDAAALAAALPASAKKIAVLDRTKEPGSIGEPLYLDVMVALAGRPIKIIGGRYGLSSKEFTPAMVKAVYDHLDGKATHGFTVGITDDVTHTSIPVGPVLDTELPGTVRCKFFGYGSDGTVGANKNSIKIIADHTDMYGQGYFQYDSKKSGGVTISHLRFGKSPIQSQYFLNTVDFVALHKPSYIGRLDILEGIREGGVFLINCEWKASEVFEHLTEDMQRTIIDKKIKVFTIDALKIAGELGLGLRINSIMQACFFKLSGVLPEAEAIALMKKAVEKTYGRKGKDVVQMNWDAIDRAAAGLEAVPVPARIVKSAPVTKIVPDDASAYAREVIDPVTRFKGDLLPVSKMPLDGAVPTATARLEKRGIATECPKWLPENCIQCNQCNFVCPHATIRAKQIAPADLAGAPDGFVTIKSNTKNDRGLLYREQCYIEDCVGCGSCAQVCPAKVKALVMTPIAELRAAGEAEKAEFFDRLPDNVIDGIKADTLKGSQFLRPLFEFSGACAGCGETPYVKLVTQLYGERMIIANATGCSSIYGGTFPTSPYCVTAEGKGPAWGNSLFEDNAEYGFGMRLAVDANRRLLAASMDAVTAAGTTPALADALAKMKAAWTSVGDEAKAAAKAVLAALPEALKSANGAKPHLAKIAELKDFLIEKSVWCIGGDGWAYDIGYGGLDHVLAMNRKINVLVLDTEVYSNTGGQASKVHADRLRGQVRLVRQEDRQEEPGPHGHELRLRLRRLGRHGRQHDPVPQGLPRSRGLPRPVDHHRLFALHQPRHRHEQGPGRSRSWPWTRAIGPSIASIRCWRMKARTRSSSIPRNPSSNTTSSSRTKPGTRRSSSSSPRSPRSCSPGPPWNRASASRPTRRWRNRPRPDIVPSGPGSARSRGFLFGSRGSNAYGRLKVE